MTGSSTCWKLTHDPGAALLSHDPIDISLASMGSIFQEPENFFIIPCCARSNNNCTHHHTRKTSNQKFKKSKKSKKSKKLKKIQKNSKIKNRGDLCTDFSFRFCSTITREEKVPESMRNRHRPSCSTSTSCRLPSSSNTFRNTTSCQSRTP
jgi:hypothetical protein